MNANSQREKAPNTAMMSTAVTQSVWPTTALELRTLNARFTTGKMANATAPATRSRRVVPAVPTRDPARADARSTRMIATGRKSAIENTPPMVSNQSGAAV